VPPGSRRKGRLLAGHQPGAGGGAQHLAVHAGETAGWGRLPASRPGQPPENLAAGDADDEILDIPRDLYRDRLLLTGVALAALACRARP
jgi:hypothetical protein